MLFLFVLLETIIQETEAHAGYLWLCRYCAGLWRLFYYSLEFIVGRGGGRFMYPSI